MDKKNTTIGVLLILAAFAFLIYGQRFSPPPAAAPAPAPAAHAAPAAPATTAATRAPAAGEPSATEVTAPTNAFADLAHDATPATITTLQNDFVIVHFTNLGGAVQDVALKKYPAELGRPQPFVFNELHADPLLAFTDFAGLDRRTKYALVSHTATEVVYRTAIFEGRVEVTRRFTLVARPDKHHDPYQLRDETTFRNLSGETIPLPRLSLSLGTAAPVNALDTGLQLTAGYSSGQKQTFFPRAKLEASHGFFGAGAHDAVPFIASPGPIDWAAVTNQFFAAILTPDQPGTGLLTRRVKLFPGLPDDDRNAYGLTAAAQFEIAPIAAHGAAQLAGELYVGPKEYRRLANADVFKADQDKVMQFGFFHYFSQILLTLMTWIHGWFHGATWAWGWAIVLTTLILKTCFVPFTLAASRSARRMQKIQPELTALREKFKDNPQKLQAATMELFKKHKVNPMGGCLPMLFTLPFFWGFFQMLRSAAELRFAPFLWARDLASPDTIGHLFGLPINILPLLMGTATFLQMNLTPQPSVDNAQAKMMKFMPVVYILFCYNYSCALSLYMLINAIFSVGQQLVINRMKDTGDPAAAVAMAPAGSNRPLKNVTPKKR